MLQQAKCTEDVDLAYTGECEKPCNRFCREDYTPGFSVKYSDIQKVKSSRPDASSEE